MPATTQFARRISAFPLLLLLVPLLAGCGDGGTEPPDELAPLVGLWEAETLVMTSQANPSLEMDLVEMGALFTISILGSGEYTAYLKAFGQEAATSGTVSVSGDTFVLHQSDGPATTGTWRLEEGDLILEGETEFDFNQDGETEPAFVYMELFHVKQS